METFRIFCSLLSGITTKQIEKFEKDLVNSNESKRVREREGEKL
jgi:hypothetical protein